LNKHLTSLKQFSHSFSRNSQHVSSNLM